MARHLFVVSRDKPWLYGYLVERFADDPKVTVIFDRRMGERRQTERPAPLERRHVERRARRDPEDDELTTQGYVIVDL